MPLVSMLFSVLGVHISCTQFQYPQPHLEGTFWPNGQLGGRKWGNNGQLSAFVEAICRDFRQHDEEEFKKTCRMAEADEN